MKFFDYINDIEQFYEENGYNINPRPAVVLDETPINRFDPFIKTGHYAAGKNEITLYIDQRHVKDILRTFCHELFHRVQANSDPKFADLDVSGNLVSNSELEQYEAEAYRIGNLLFRKWTESKQDTEE